MKFICQSCARGFEFGAPKGMQLPCPACGGMLVDEESSAGAPSPSAPPPPVSPPPVSPPPPPVPPPPRPAASAFAPGAVSQAPAPSAPEAPLDEISLDAAEAFLQQSEQGGAAPVEADPGAAVQPLPAEAPPSEPLPAEAPPSEPLPAQAPSSEQLPALEQELQLQPPPEAGWPEGAQPAEAGAEQAPVGPEGLPPEGGVEQAPVGPEGLPPEGGVEQAASPFVLTLGWVLFGICLVGLGVMGYFLRVSYAKLRVARDATKLHSDNVKLRERCKDLSERAGRLEEERDGERAKVKAFLEEIPSLKARTERAEKTEKRKTVECERLTAELASSTRMLSGVQADSTRLLELKEKMQIEAGRARARLAAGREALRAIDFLGRPERWNEALSWLDSAVRRAKDSGEDFMEARWLRGRLLAKLRRGEDAVRDFDMVDELVRSENAAGHVRALVAAGDVCRTQLGDRERAIRFYRRASEAAPESPFAKLAQARLRVMSGKPESGRGMAERAARQAKKGGEDWAQLWLLVAEVIAGDPGNRPKAIKELGKVIAAQPDNVEALDRRGELLLEEKHPEKAVGDLSRANVLDPLDNARLVTLGAALLDVERYSEALPMLERAAKALPDSTKAKVQLGRALVAVGRHEEAVQPLSEAIIADPKNVEAYRLKGEAGVARGQYREGVRDLNEALRLGKGDDPRVRVLLAEVYTQAKEARFREPEKAVSHAKVAVELTKGRDARALAALANAHAACGRYALAANEMRRAVALRPDKTSFKQLLRQYKGAAKK